MTFLVPAIIMTYYSVIGGWILKYALVYLTGAGAAAAEDGFFTGFITSKAAPVCFMLIFLAVTAFIVYRGGWRRASKSFPGSSCRGCCFWSSASRSTP